MSTSATHGDVTSRRSGEEMNPQVKKAGEEMKELEVTQDQSTGSQSYHVGTTEKEQSDIKHPQGLTEKEQVGQQTTPGMAVPIEVTHEPLKAHGEKLPLSETGAGGLRGREIPITDVTKEGHTQQPTQLPGVGKPQQHEGSEQQQIRGVSGEKPAHPTTESLAKAESLKKVSEGPEVSGLLPAGKGEPPEAKPGHLVSEKVLAEGLMKHDEPAVVQGVEGRAPIEYESPEKSETYHEREKTKPSP